MKNLLFKTALITIATVTLSSKVFSSDLSVGYEKNNSKKSGDYTITFNFDGIDERIGVTRIHVMPSSLKTDQRYISAEVHPYLKDDNLQDGNGNKILISVLPFSYEENMKPGIIKRIGIFPIKMGVIPTQPISDNREGLDGALMTPEFGILGAHYIEVEKDPKLDKYENSSRDPKLALTIYELNLALIDMTYTFKNQSYISFRIDATNTWTAKGDNHSKNTSHPYENYRAGVFLTRVGSELRVSAKNIGAYIKGNFQNTINSPSHSGDDPGNNYFNKGHINMGVRVVF